MLAVLDHVGVDAMHFWGTHTGAAIGLLLATGDQGHRIRSLILDGVVLPGVEMPSVTRNYGRAKVTARTRGIEAARREWFDQSEWFDVTRAHRRGRSGPAGGGGPGRGRLRSPHRRHRRR